MGCGVTRFMTENKITLQDNVLEDVSVNFLGAGVGVKQVTLKAGQEVLTHKHKYDHLSILVYGKVTVMTDEEAHELEGPESIVVKAELNHYLKAETDALWLCVHRTDSMETKDLCV
jgi:quercetin dioxygenase-like cupin family protein